MKNLSKVLALVLVIAMLFSFAVSANAAVVSYKDGATITYGEAVDLLSALEVLHGYKDGTFKPTASITRGEFAVMVSYMVANSMSENPLYDDIEKLGANYAPLCTFADTKKHWSAGYVAFCAGNGYISGRDANTFDPDATITVAEISVILLRVLGYDATIEQFGTTAGTVKGYNTQITARNADILVNLGNTNFWAPATREVAAQLMFNALNAHVVEYAGSQFSLILTAADGSTTTVKPNSTAKTTEVPLMYYCFRGVRRIDGMVDEYGYTGHQWFSQPTAELKKDADGIYIDYTGPRTALTGIYADDYLLKQYAAATPYSKIANDLGAKADSKVAVEVYLNGALIAGSNTKDDVTDFYDTSKLTTIGKQAADVLAKSMGDIAVNARNGGALPDNCRLDVVVNSNRTVTLTTYKLMYYYEVVGKAGRAAKITKAGDPNFGKYEYPINFFYGYDDIADVTDAKTWYLYDAAENAYSGYYLVEPDEVNPGSFLSVKKAATEAVKITAGKYEDFEKNVGVNIYDAKWNAYGVSHFAHDFTKDGADYGTLNLIYSSSKSVIGFADPAQDSDIIEVGYLYSDLLEFSVYATTGSTLIDPQNATRSAQAKAQVYFPTEKGNDKASVIDLKIVTDFRNLPSYIDIQSDDAATALPGDDYVKADKIDLGTVATTAWSDNGTNYTYSNTAIGKVRVYANTYDGWFFYMKHKDGTYSLIDVDQLTVDEITVKNGNVNATLNGAAALINENTTYSLFTMNLTTMTAKVTKTVGYKEIKSNTYKPVIVSKPGMYVTAIDQFNVVLDNQTNYTLFRGVQVFYNDGTDKYLLDFIGGGDAYPRQTYAGAVEYDGTTTKVDGTELAEAPIARKVDDTVTEVTVYNLTYAGNRITAIAENGTATKAAVKDTGKTYVVIGSTGYNYNASRVWDYSTGKKTTVAAGDTIFYKLNGSAIEAMWVIPGTNGSSASLDDTIFVK